MDHVPADARVNRLAHCGYTEYAAGESCARSSPLNLLEDRSQAFCFRRVHHFYERDPALQV